MANTLQLSYYPFGMNITALSNSAPMSMPNRFKYNGNEEQTDFDWNVYDFNARGYDAVLGRFMQVDPMADKRTWVNPYNYVQNNPLLRVDPAGTVDWIKNKEGEIVFDENATSQETTKEGETYLGESGWGEINEETGNRMHYNVDGTTSEYAFNGGDVTVTANPVEMAVDQAGINFMKGAAELTGELGVGTTAVALVIAPFAPPVAAALFTVGNGLSVTSSVSTLTAKAAEGDVTLTDFAVEGGAAILGGAGGNSLKALPSGATRESMRGVLENSLNVTTEIIIPEIRERTKKQK